MKKLIVVAALAAVSFGAAAEVKQLTEEQLKLIDTPVKTLTPEQRTQRDAAVRLQDLIRHGGAMPYPGTPQGTIRYINLQKRVPTGDLTKAMRAFGPLMQYDVKIVGADCDATLKIRIVDDATAPMLLVAPEDRWAQINVAKLAVDDPKPAFLAARTRKEMLRAFAFLTAGSSNGSPLLSPLKDVKSLDKLVERGFAIDVMMRSKKYLEVLGVVPLEMANYRALLECGFDISPTNDYQKAIYAEVKKPAKK